MTAPSSAAWSSASHSWFYSDFAWSAVHTFARQYSQAQDFFTDGIVRYGLLTEISEPASLRDAL